MRQIHILWVFFLMFGCKNSVTHKNLNTRKIQEEIVEVNNKTLNKTVYNVIKYYNNKNEEELNKLIHPELGLFFLYRRGTIDEWEKIKKVALLKKSLNKMDIPWWYKETLVKQKLINDFKIKTSNDIIFVECDSISKKGMFIIENQKYKFILSNTIKNYIKAQSNDILSKQSVEKLQIKIKKVNEWENVSKRIVLVKSEYESLIFHLVNVNNKWYLFIFDFITNDCSV